MENRKKILFLITKGNFGGAQRYVFDLATSLPKEKFDVVVGCGEGETLPRKLEGVGVRTIRVSGLKRDINFAREFAVFKNIVRLIQTEKPDILHLNSSKMGALGALAGRLARTPLIVFTGHGWAFNEERPFLSKSFIALAHWFTILLSHRVIAVSKNIESQINRFPFVSQRIVCIHNGIDEFKTLSKKEARKKIAPDRSEKIWIGTISELHKNKGIDFIIRAFAETTKTAKDVLLLVIGDGEERKCLERLVQQYRIERHVFFAGFIDDARQYLPALDIFTLTSRTEAFPYAPLEAGIAELPVIASSVGGIPEIIANNKSGILVQKGNVSEIHNALIELTQNNRKRNSLGRELREKTLTDFSKNKMLDETILVYTRGRNF